MELVRAAVAARSSGCRVVALDVAGPEAGCPLDVHEEAYREAHRLGLRATVHAGEVCGNGYVADGVRKLFADRIGHGLHIFRQSKCDPSLPEDDSARLVSAMVDRRVGVEVCLTSNLQTQPGLSLVSTYIILKFLVYAKTHGVTGAASVARNDSVWLDSMCLY